MLRQISFSCAFFFVCAVANAIHTPESFIKLSLGVSKATYLPTDSGRFLQNGRIIENPSLSSTNDNPKDDQTTCNTVGWTAKAYEDQETEALMFENVEQKLVVFGFRGTEGTNINDWKYNLDMKLVEVKFGANSFQIHKGFLRRYDIISSWFENEYSQVPNDYTILLTGHSLGGAEATIAAVYAAVKLNRKPDSVITFGSPKVGTSQFADYYKEMVGCDRTIRMSVKFDVAPSFPFSSKYKHVCELVDVPAKFLSNVLSRHNLYRGYEYGIEKAYKDMNEINVGCDQKRQI